MRSWLIEQGPVSERFLYPRLPKNAAFARLEEIRGLSPQTADQLAAVSHPEASPAATGGVPANESQLRDLQQAIRALADEHGFPEPPGLRAIQTFDRRCGTMLYREMGIVPADAANEGVWSFLSLVVSPGVATWRFKDQAGERMLGMPRNVFRRLWWRAWAVGPDLEAAPEGCRPLGEDEFVGIMERPTIGGNPIAARAIRDALWALEPEASELGRMRVMRHLSKRFLARLAFTSLEGLDVAELRSLTDEVGSAALAAARIDARGV